jgi:ribosomal protein L37AE/L43A
MTECEHKNAHRIYAGLLWFCPDCEATLKDAD